MKPPFKHRCPFLLITILFILLSSAFIDEESRQWERISLGMTWAILVGIGGYLIASSKKWLISYATAMVVVAISAILESFIDSNKWIYLLQNTGVLSIQACALYAALGYSLSQERGNALDHTLSGICGYFLLGLAWSRLFVIVQIFDPQAFSGNTLEPLASENDLIYYSLVNLTTLGYGDIVPVNNLARILSALESALGTLYLAVLVATLVSQLRQKS